jgi:hypothetical protein
LTAPTCSHSPEQFTRRYRGCRASTQGQARGLEFLWKRLRMGLLGRKHTARSGELGLTVL